MKKKVSHPYLIQILGGYWYLTKFTVKNQPYEIVKELNAKTENQAEREALKYLFF